MTTITPVLERAPSFSSVAAGSTASVTLPRSRTYFDLNIYYTPGGTAANTATIAADIDEIRLVINGTVQRRFTGAQLRMLNNLRGLPLNDGEMRIYFASPWRVTAVEEDAGALGTANLQTVVLEVDINAAATSPQLAVYARTMPINANAGAITKVRQFTLSPSATGVFEWSDLPKMDPIHALHFNSANISHIEVVSDNRTLLDAPVPIIHNDLDDYGWTAQPGWTHLLFDRRNRGAEFLSFVRQAGPGVNDIVRVQDLRIQLTMGATGAFQVLAEYWGAPN